MCLLAKACEREFVCVCIFMGVKECVGLRAREINRCKKSCTLYLVDRTQDRATHECVRPAFQALRPEWHWHMFALDSLTNIFFSLNNDHVCCTDDYH